MAAEKAEFLRIQLLVRVTHLLSTRSCAITRLLWADDDGGGYAIAAR